MQIISTNLKLFLQQIKTQNIIFVLTWCIVYSIVPFCDSLKSIKPKLLSLERVKTTRVGHLFWFMKRGHPVGITMWKGGGLIEWPENIN